MTLSKTNKRIMSELYLMGMPKDSVYKTMKNEGFKVNRKDVRNYLNHDRMYAKISENYNYKKRVRQAKKAEQHGIIPDAKEEIDRLNRNYLIHVSIRLLDKKKVKYTKALQKIVVKNPMLGFTS